MLLLNRSCKLQNFPIPKGYTVKTTGDAVRGDLYWNCLGEEWRPIEDDKLYLHQPVRRFQCVITPIPDLDNGQQNR